MSIDPYHAVEQEVQATLQIAVQLRSSYLRIQSTAGEESEELQYAISELKGTLAALEADLDDLDESVKIVESTDARNFGLDYVEVQRRRQYVTDVRKEIQVRLCFTFFGVAQVTEPYSLLDDLERGVDATDSKLNNAMRRMRHFMRQSEEKGSGWCIIILIIILMILLLAVILI
ncbi:hypothetical protein C0989_003578 [Termitomyces sp. Mn162]|nr:hypothetical protein C0989_003578 [Termitomyces sp. Mn162]